MEETKQKQWTIRKRNGVITSASEGAASIEAFPWAVDGPQAPFAFGELCALTATRDKADEIVRAVNSFDELVDALKAMIETRVRHSTHALHPSKRFCNHCGQNSETAVHVEGCPVGIAEDVIARAEQIEGERI